MSISITDFENKVREWVVDQTGRITIWENLNGNRPVVGFISLFTTLNEKVCEDRVDKSSDANGDTKIYSHRRLVIRITARGVEGMPKIPMQVMHDLQFSLSKPSVQEAFDLDGIAIIRSTTPASIPVLMNKMNYEDACSFDVTFGAGFVEVDKTEFFNVVDIDGTLVKEDGTEINIDLEEISS